MVQRQRWHVLAWPTDTTHDAHACWHATVTAPSETDALHRGLAIFLATEDTRDIEFDFTTIAVARASRKSAKTT